MNDICAGIVLYNPDVDRLKKNINSICSQVGKVIIVDNGSSNISEVSVLMQSFDNIVFVQNENNLGIATALNQICEKAVDEKFSWVLTLDQDSICPHDMIRVMSEYLKYENVGIVCPQFYNTVSKEKKAGQLAKYDYVEMCITSGSLMSLEAWNKCGRFDDWMFIDCVDYDICLKLRLLGYSILRINNLILEHCVGNGKKVKVLGIFETIVYNHSEMRNYYFVRNYVYIIRKYRKIIHPMKRSVYILVWELKKILLEPNKWKTLSSALRGLRDGLKV